LRFALTGIGPTMNLYKSMLKFGLIALIVIMAFCSSVSMASIRPKSVAGPPNRISGPVPLLVLIQYEPMKMVIGNDSPSFVLYDDGTVIYRKYEHGIKFLSVKLSAQERADVMQKIRQDDFDSLESRYDWSGGSTDQPADLMLRRISDGTYKSVYVYGSLQGITDAMAKTVRLLPVSLSAFRFMSTYDNPTATEWWPDYIKLLIWPYKVPENRHPDVVNWPEGWPGLDDATTVKVGDGYELRLEKAKFLEIKGLVSRNVIRIDRKDWVMGRVLIPFPHEEIWTEIKSHIR